MSIYEKIKTGIKIAGAFALAIMAFIFGRKLWALFSGGVVKETKGSIENPNKAKDLSEADRVKADRETLNKDI